MIPRILYDSYLIHPSHLLYLSIFLKIKINILYNIKCLSNEIIIYLKSNQPPNNRI